MLTPHPDVLFREIDEECVLLDLGSGTYFGLNEVGTRVWNLLREGVPEDEIVRTIADEYDNDAETIRADVRRFLTELESRKLIVHGGASPA
jgi:coenzyme PQQ synthesis protein D (PqqD)